MRVALVMLALTAAGCASFMTIPRLLSQADELVAAGDFEGALRAYDDALVQGADGRAGLHARAGRTLTAATLRARADLGRVEAELARLREDVVSREREVQRLARDLTARDGELSRAKQDLTARQAELLRVSTEAEQLRMNLEDLKRMEIRMERRRQ